VVAVAGTAVAGALVGVAADWGGVDVVRGSVGCAAGAVVNATVAGGEVAIAICGIVVRARAMRGSGAPLERPDMSRKAMTTNASTLMTSVFPCQVRASHIEPASVRFRFGPLPSPTRGPRHYVSNGAYAHEPSFVRCLGSL
jgi:hypothetical protein